MIRRSVLRTAVLAVLVAGGSWVAADEGPQYEGMAVPDQFRWRPTAVPDRIVLTWEEDPATSISVTWRTDSSVTTAILQIAEADDGPKFLGTEVTHEALTAPFTSNLSLSHRHSVTVTQLTPETTYVYRVGDGTNWSEWNQFRTASADAKPFRFVYFGDAQNDILSLWSRVVRQAYADAPKAAFLLHAGDLVNRGNSCAEWGEWFASSGFIHRSMPAVATPGNHEYPRISDDQRQLSLHWEPTFTLPKNGPEGPGLSETVYYLDYQGVRFISLNSNEGHEAQAEWLPSVLEDNPCQWTVVSYHHPMFSSKDGRDNPHLRELWLPLFDQYGVDLVLQGHDHTYSRTGLMNGTSNLTTGVRTNTETGAVYVVSVSGPKMYDIGRKPYMQRAAEDTQLYQVIDIDGDTLKYEARTATGRLYDAFTLTKSADGPNILKNQIPDVPERLRTGN